MQVLAHSQFCFCPSLSRRDTNFAVICLMLKCSTKMQYYVLYERPRMLPTSLLVCHLVLMNQLMNSFLLFGNLTWQWVTWTSRIRRSLATFESWICFRDSLYRCSHYIPADGTLMPQHVGVWYFQGILFNDVYFIMFYWVHLLVVNVRICMVWIA